MERSDGQEAKAPEDVIRERDEIYVLQVQFSSFNHSFEMPNKQTAMEYVELAKHCDWVEIENENTYLLVPGASSGTAFIVMSKANLFKIHEMQRRQAEAQQNQQMRQAMAQTAAQRLVLPNGR